MGCDGSGCPAPTWDDFKTHTFFCVGTWLGLMCFGLVAASLRHLWDVERVSGWLHPLAVFLKEDKYFLFLVAILSLLMCFLYVLYAQGDVVFDWANMVETVSCYIHAAEVLTLMIYNCAMSQDDIMAFATSRLFSDCLVCVSVLMRGKVGNSYFSFAFAASLRVRNIWTSFEATISPLDKGFKVKLCHEAVKLLSRIFVFAAMMHQLESFQGKKWMSQAWEPWETATSPTQVWTTTSSVYLVLCTLSTVGYGDIQPRSIIGQILLMAIIVAGIGLVIATVVGLMEIAQCAGGGSGGEYRIHSARRMRRHVVICGTPAAQTLEDLLAELYHDDHMEVAKYLDSVILLPPGSQGVIERVQKFLHLKDNRKILGKVWMLEGSPLHQRDLERTKLGSASMGYVLPNMHAADSEREDIDNAMRALSMHRFAPYVRLVAMLLKVEYREMMLATGLSPKDVVCIDEVKLGIMGKTCEAQGFVTLVCNLFKSAGEFDESGECERWYADYKRGMGNEIYETRLFSCYRGAPFGEVAIDILKRSDCKAYMIGVIDESRYPGEEPVIHMHPGRQYRIGTNEDYVLKGIFIAPDLEVIHQHPADKPFSWNLKSSNVGVSEGSAAAPLPNALPEKYDSNDILVQMAQRWIQDKKVVKREHDVHTRQLMDNAASTRTVQGLKNMGHMPRPEIEEVMAAKVEEDMWKSRNYASIEDGAEEAKDPKERALLQQQLKAATTQEKEKQKSVALVRARTEERVRRMCETMVVNADAELEMWEDPRAAGEKEIDDELWGGVQTPRKPLWGNPMAPPPSALIRGEHVIMIALEGNEDIMASGSEQGNVESTGRKLGLQHFINAVRADLPPYAHRPIVVLAQRVPYDWPRVTAQHQHVYLITGRPLAEANLRQSGLRHAKAVIIYQRGQVSSSDPILVDAQAIFGTALAESLLRQEAQDVMCIVDLHLDNNSYFVVDEDDREIDYHADELDMKSAREIVGKPATPYVDTKRYSSGQLFASGQAITSLVANMLYNPALGSLVLEMLRSRFVVVSVPIDFSGTTFQELYEYMLRRRNLIVVALLRNFTEDAKDDAEKEEEKVEPLVKGWEEEAPPQRYNPRDPPRNRFIYTMPPGDRKVTPCDGIMCVVPKGDTLAFLD